MAHVKISRKKRGEPLRLEVDGVDMTMDVYDEGFGLVRVGDPAFQDWGIRMIVAADSLDIDLPDAVIQAIAKSEDEMAAGDEQ